MFWHIAVLNATSPVAIRMKDCSRKGISFIAGLVAGSVDALTSCSHSENGIRFSSGIPNAVPIIFMISGHDWRLGFSRCSTAGQGGSANKISDMAVAALFTGIQDAFCR